MAGNLVNGLLGVRGGGGVGGLTLGPPTNSFNAATEAAAEAARDAYAAANAGWLAQYDAEPTYTIILSWPVAPTNTKYQARRSNAWADLTGILRGPRGAAGAGGSSVAAQQADGTELEDVVTAFRAASGITLAVVSPGVVSVASAGAQPVVAGSRLIGWSAVQVPTNAELLAATEFQTPVLTIPAQAADAFLFFAVDDSIGYPSEAYFDGNSQDILGGFNQIDDRTVSGTDYVIGISNGLQSAAILGTGSRTLTLR